MKRRDAAALAAVALGLASACNVTALADRERTRAVNECTSDDDCGSGVCRVGSCVATEGSFTGLLFELKPTSGAGWLAGKSQFAAFDIPRDGGVRSLSFGGGTRLTIRIEAPEACGRLLFQSRDGIPVYAANDRTIPARVTLRPAVRALGINVESYTAEVDTTNFQNPANPIGGDSYSVTLGVPTGFYDVYIEPRPVIFDDSASLEERVRCSLPPQLLRQQAIAPQGVDLLLKLAPAAGLDLEVRFPPEQSLGGWQLDVLEPSGSLISSRVPIPADAKTNYTVGLSYNPVAFSGDTTSSRSGDELIRISPPASTIAPTLLFERRALELIERGRGVVAPLLRLPAVVTVEGQVRTRDSIEPVRGVVTLTATRVLAAPPGIFATFSSRIPTDRDGRFSARLVAGSYRVQVTPEASLGENAADLKLSTADWEVPAEPRVQSGRVLAVDPLLRVSGRAVLGWNNTAALGSIVGFDPAVPIPSPDVLARSLGDVSVPPRAVRTAIADASGDFSFTADTGTQDFFVRPPEASGVPWLVVPNVLLENEPRQLGRLALPLPVRLEGEAHLGAPAAMPSAALAQAHLIAYAMVDAELRPVAQLAQAHRVIPIAEGRVDGAGRYQLSVPATLNGAGQF